MKDNREILFRGKRIDNGEWAYGLPVYNADSSGIDKIEVAAVSGAVSTLVIPETVGQYTGLKDKHDANIFKDDIIEGPKRNRHVVSFDSTEARFVAKFVPNVGSGHCGIMQSWIDDYRKQVVGNIHDNPELLY